MYKRQGLSSFQAARKLTQDFGLSPDKPPSGAVALPKPAAASSDTQQEEMCIRDSPYPDEVIDRLARAFYPAILACWNSEEGQREFAAWQADQAHHANNEKQEVPSGGELPAVHIAICLLYTSYFKANNTTKLPSPKKLEAAYAQLASEQRCV